MKGCGYCKQAVPELRRLHKRRDIYVLVVKAEESTYAKDYGIAQFPTFFILGDESVVFQTSSIDELKRELR